METFGYAGKILKVDLGSFTIKEEELDIEMAKKYLGGMGLGMRAAYDSIEPGTDPLSHENKIYLTAGALAGALAPSATKITAVTKFPVNGAVGTACGCSFAPMLKWAGYDQIMLTGASSKPVYLQIIDDKVKICDASHLWGKDIFETTDILHNENGEDFCVICIGQAGENMVRTSLALIDKISHLGRGGLAAVMGSKKLKAIVVKGTKGIKVADPDGCYRIFDFLKSRSLSDRGRDLWVNYGLMGIVENWFNNSILVGDNKRKILNAQNLVEKYGLQAYRELIDTTPWAGLSCITCDKTVCRIKNGRLKGFTTTTSFTPAPVIIGTLGNIPLDEAMKVHDLFQRYGIDELDTLYSLDLLADLRDKGLLSSKDMEIDLKFDLQTLSKVLEMIAYKQGFWGIVADGLPRIKEEVKGAGEHLIALKGLAPSFDARSSLGVEVFDELTQPRGAQAGSGLVRSPSTAVPGIPTMMVQIIAATYQVPISARKRIFHNDDWHVGRLTAYVQNTNTAHNCLGTCTRFFIGRLYNPVVAAGIYKAVTGIDTSAEEINLIGERVWNLQKAANYREGFERKDDEFPERWVKEPLKTEKDEEIYIQNYIKTKRLNKADVDKLLDGYYEEREWNVKKGIPTKDKLIKLGLDDVAKDLEKRKLI